jgi:hypothetical protein
MLNTMTTPKLDKKIAQNETTPVPGVKKTRKSPVAADVSSSETCTVPKKTIKKKAASVDSIAEVAVVPVETVPVETVKPKRVKKNVAKEVVEEVGGNEEVEEVNVEEVGGDKEKTAVKRVFTVVSITSQDNPLEYEGGKTLSKTPAGAARKAANKACKVLFNEAETCVINIVIRETTKNSSSKEYSYVATRTKSNDEPVKFNGTAGTVPIMFKYSLDLKSLKREVASATTVSVSA